MRRLVPFVYLKTGSSVGVSLGALENALLSASVMTSRVFVCRNYSVSLMAHTTEHSFIIVQMHVADPRSIFHCLLPVISLSQTWHLLCSPAANLVSSKILRVKVSSVYSLLIMLVSVYL